MLSIRKRQNFDTMISINTLALLLFSLLAANPAVGYAKTTQSLDSLHKAIETYINNHYQESNQFDFVLPNIDPRLKLPACNMSLSVFSQSNHLKAGKNSLSLSCKGQKKWTIYTHVFINAYKNVLVLQKPMKRGDILTPHHLTFQPQNLAELRRGYLTNPAIVLNQEAKYNLKDGRVISSDIFVEPKIIKRGEKISIHAASTSFQVSMKGIAMSDGRHGENIRVKNITSKRTIFAKVIKPGHVQVY